MVIISRNNPWFKFLLVSNYGQPLINDYLHTWCITLVGSIPTCARWVWRRNLRLSLLLTFYPVCEAKDRDVSSGITVLQGGEDVKINQKWMWTLGNIAYRNTSTEENWLSFLMVIKPGMVRFHQHEWWPRGCNSRFSPLLTFFWKSLTSCRAFSFS